MRKIILGLVAAAAIASPLAATTAAHADTVSTDPTCVPVKHVDAYTETLYKYVPAGKVSDGPTQWDNVKVDAGFKKDFLVKGKTVHYISDGKTSSLFHAAVEGATCNVSYSATLPNSFEIDKGDGYFATQVTKTFTNNTDTDEVVNVMYADQQPGPLWIERGVFDNWYHEVVIPAHSDKTITFDVWYDAQINSGSDVPDDLTLSFSVTTGFDWV